MGNDELVTDHEYSGIAFIALAAAMIVANDGGPPSATAPVRIMTVCYATVAMAATIRFTSRYADKAGNHAVQRGDA